MKPLVRNLFNNVPQRKKSLITYLNPNSILSDQYRTIITNLQFASIEQSYRSLLITSPGYGEGKTTTVANLAVSLALQGEKVLLIDGDLRKPSIHDSFKLENNIGLTNVLIGNAVLSEAVHQTEIGRLAVLTSGSIPHNPSELIASQAMRDLMSNMQKQYDYILFDCPPVLNAVDTKILANECDGVVLVVNNGKTDKEKALEANKILTAARASLLGIVLNEFK
ncbi:MULTISPECIES: CpsD/CapB family tyrosine-protein kinase [Metabacillus]|uniref:CpsD/CapB family tyrosine-protein kinase n=1 Tax=Metabacillus TaxID=2675233 RepID=UPI0009D70B54|nr:MULTISPECIES: CpsD/CapB family tyrosine-protein kinase [Metabacillus]